MQEVKVFKEWSLIIVGGGEPVNLAGGLRFNGVRFEEGQNYFEPYVVEHHKFSDACFNSET